MKKAVSLVEVSVVLAIVATVLVIAARVATGFLVQVKNNELLDFTNSILVQAIEVAKSPEDVFISKTFSSVDGSYSLQVEGDTEEQVSSPVFGEDINVDTFLVQESADTDANIGNGDCDINSPYHVRVNTEQQDFVDELDLCVQLLIEDVSTGGTSTYKMTANVVADFQQQTITKSLIGYRVKGFEEIEQN